MDIFFENHYTHTKEYFKELNFYSFFQKPVSNVMHIIFAIAIIIGVISLIFPNVIMNNSLAMFYIFFPLFIRIASIIQYFKSIKIRYNQELEINHGNPVEARMVVTDDRIEAYILHSESKNFIELQNIKKIAKTKNYYLLITNAKLYCVFKKDGFVAGTSDEFLSFLRAKGFKC